MATINLGSIKFNWKGTYAGGTAYVVDDVVEYNGSSYICILASTGNLPTNATYFEQMSSAGTNGTDGTDLTSTLTTQGDIVYRDASGLARLGAGTSGQALITNGTGANPSWGTVSSDFVKLAETNVTSSTASVTLDGYFSSTYSNYKLIITDLIMTSVVQLRSRIVVNGSANTSTNYYVSQISVYGGSGGGNVDASRDWGQNHFQMLNWSLSSNTAYTSCFYIDIPNPLDTSTNPRLCSNHFVNSDNFNYLLTGNGIMEYDNPQSFTGLEFSGTSGSISKGNFYLYGIKD